MSQKLLGKDLCIGWQEFIAIDAYTCRKASGAMTNFVRESFCITRARA